LGPVGRRLADTIEVNLYSTFYCSRAAAKELVRQGEGGVILNVSSGTALRSTPNSFGYAAAKAGVISLTKSVAGMLVGENIASTASSPVLWPNSRRGRTRRPSA